MKHKEFTRRNLPHIQCEGATMFVTFRLFDSLPKSFTDKLRKDFDNAVLALQEEFSLNKSLYREKFEKLHAAHFQQVDVALHRIKNGPQWLLHEAIAKIVAEALQYWDEKRIELMSYCIMPNHVHVVFRLFTAMEGETRTDLSEIMHSIKSFSAKKCNKILGRHGNFWTEESYDCERQG